jgi:hypothetical protein
MARHTDDPVHAHTSTDTVLSSHAHQKILIIALTIVACILICAFALDAIAYTVGAVVLLIVPVLLACIIDRSSYCIGDIPTYGS